MVKERTFIININIKNVKVTLSVCLLPLRVLPTERISMKLDTHVPE